MADALLRQAEAVRSGSCSVDALFAAAKTTTDAPAAKNAHTEQDLLKSVRTGDHASFLAILRSGMNGININCRGAWDGMTALHWCAEKNHSDMARLLVTEGGTNIDALDTNKWTPLIAAVAKNHRGMVELLLSLGADSAPKIKGRTIDWTCYAVDDAMLTLLPSTPIPNPSSRRKGVEKRTRTNAAAVRSSTSSHHITVGTGRYSLRPRVRASS